MILSPDAFTHLYENAAYSELLAVREELLSEIRGYEQSGYVPGSSTALPAPEAVYRTNLECLSRLCRMTAEKYMLSADDVLGKAQPSPLEPLTKHLTDLETGDFGAWTQEQVQDGPYSFPIMRVNYSPSVRAFLSDFAEFCAAHPEYHFENAPQTLDDHNIEWSLKSLSEADCTNMDEGTVLTLLFCGIQSEQFREGAILDLLESGSIQRWLHHLEGFRPTA